MNMTFRFLRKMKVFFSLFLLVVFLIFQNNVQITYALPMDNYESGFITEELRLKILKELVELIGIFQLNQPTQFHQIM